MLSPDLGMLLKFRIELITFTDACEKVHVCTLYTILFKPTEEGVEKDSESNKNKCREETEMLNLFLSYRREVPRLGRITTSYAWARFPVEERMECF